MSKQFKLTVNFRTILLSARSSAIGESSTAAKSPILFRASCPSLKAVIFSGTANFRVNSVALDL